MKGIRKAGIISITLLFLAMSVGVGFRIHYCHGDVSSAAYFTAEPACECSYEISGADCCSTVSQYIVLDDDRIPVSVIKTLIPEAVAILNPEAGSGVSQLLPDRPECQAATTCSSASRYILYHALIFYS